MLHRTAYALSLTYLRFGVEVDEYVDRQGHTHTHGLEPGCLDWTVPVVTTEVKFHVDRRSDGSTCYRCALTS